MKWALTWIIGTGVYCATFSPTIGAAYWVGVWTGICVVGSVIEIRRAVSRNGDA